MGKIRCGSPDAKNLAKSLHVQGAVPVMESHQRKSTIFPVAALDNSLKSFYLKAMDIVAILNSLASILVISTVIGLVIVGAYLAYKEEKRKKQGG